MTCWLKGAEGDALHAVLCACGYNIRWLLRAIQRLGIRAVFLRLLGRWETLRSAQTRRLALPGLTQFNPDLADQR